MIQEDIKEYDDEIKMHIGNRIQEVRIAKGVAASDLAAYLNIGSNQMSRIETGKANCTIPQMFIISQLWIALLITSCLAKRTSLLAQMNRKN